MIQRLVTNPHEKIKNKQERDGRTSALLVLKGRKIWKFSTLILLHHPKKDITQFRVCFPCQVNSRSPNKHKPHYLEVKEWFKLFIYGYSHFYGSPFHAWKTLHLKSYSLWWYMRSRLSEQTTEFQPRKPSRIYVPQKEELGRPWETKWPRDENGTRCYH